jgi:hypothetical protein
VQMFAFDSPISLVNRWSREGPFARGCGAAAWNARGPRFVPPEEMILRHSPTLARLPGAHWLHCNSHKVVQCLKEFFRATIFQTRQNT